ncbi:HlyC/CorC family transporter [Brackiella oedipodis]|uniref:HlyC/CorC family transporter n=1 Tax=Brackiella oedipodis TaxID=124225 RepID=UPI00048C965F|nr:transporter associated domain-containing protein [Brackiella oedipodis]
MSTDSHHESESDKDKKFSGLTGIFRRLSGMNRNDPEDRQDINDVLNAAHDKKILDDDSYSMILGALSLTEKRADDILIPRSKMDLIDINQPIQEIISFVIDAAHSRFPVFDDERDNIIGVLLAKDLLRYLGEEHTPLRELLRPPLYVPESKSLDHLLKEFRETRNHLALVIDEHGSLTGLVTMEDVLEQVVGHIEDEYDEDEQQTIFPESDNAWRFMASTPIEEFNKVLDSHIPTDEHDTMGGWLADELDHIPRRGDTYLFEDLRFYVLRAEERRALWVHVRRIKVSSSSHDEETPQS